MAEMDRTVGPFAGRIASFSDVLVTPGEERSPRPFPLKGGVQFPPGSPAWVQHCRRGVALEGQGAPAPARPPAADLPRLHGTHAYAGPVWDHFGHTMAEFLHRLWVLDQPAYADATALFVATRGKPTPRFLAPALEALGVRRWTVVEHDTLVERLVVGEPGKMLGLPPAPDYTAFLARRFAPLGAPDPRFPRRVAVLRSHLPGHCIGEAWLEAELIRQGYVAFRPEKHPIAHQIETYRRAERIVMTEGSAIHLFDIMPPVAAQVAILNRRPGSRLAEDCLAGKCAGLVTFEKVLFLGDPQRNQPGPPGVALVDYVPFLALLREHGFIDALPETDFLADAEALAAELSGYVARQMAGPRQRGGLASERVMAETVALLARRLLRPPVKAPPPKAPAPKAPLARPPLAKAPVANVPVANAPPANLPLAKPPVPKAAPGRAGAVPVRPRPPG